MMKLQRQISNLVSCFFLQILLFSSEGLAVSPDFIEGEVSLGKASLKYPLKVPLGIGGDSSQMLEIKEGTAVSEIATIISQKREHLGLTPEIPLSDQDAFFQRSYWKKASVVPISLPLTAKLTRSYVTQGQIVQESDLLFALESMKMEFSIRSPFQGVINHVFFADQTLVMEGSPILNIIPTNPEWEDIPASELTENKELLLSFFPWEIESLEQAPPITETPLQMVKNETEDQIEDPILTEAVSVARQENLVVETEILSLPQDIAPFHTDIREDKLEETQLLPEVPSQVPSIEIQDLNEDAILAEAVSVAHQENLVVETEILSLPQDIAPLHMDIREDKLEEAQLLPEVPSQVPLIEIQDLNEDPILAEAISGGIQDIPFLEIETTPHQQELEPIVEENREEIPENQTVSSAQSLQVPEEEINDIEETLQPPTAVLEELHAAPLLSYEAPLNVGLKTPPIEICKEIQPTQSPSDLVTKISGPQGKEQAKDSPQYDELSPHSYLRIPVHFQKVMLFPFIDPSIRVEEILGEFEQRAFLKMPMIRPFSSPLFSSTLTERYYLTQNVISFGLVRAPHGSLKREEISSSSQLLPSFSKPLKLDDNLIGDTASSLVQSNTWTSLALALVFALALLFLKGLSTLPLGYSRRISIFGPTFNTYDLSVDLQAQNLNEAHRLHDQHYRWAS